MIKRKLHYAWFILVGVILIRGFAGGAINLTAGLFLSPVSLDIGVGVGTLSLYLSITSIVTVLFLPLAGKVINKYDIRLIVIIAAFLQTLSFSAFGLMNNVLGWYLLAIPQAIGATILTSLLGPILINRWFVKNKGLIMGIHMSFVGIFGAILQPIVANHITSKGWRLTYIYIGLVSLATMVLASVILLRNYPADKKLDAYGANNDKQSVNDSLKFTVQVPEIVAIKSTSFYLLLLFMICVTGVAVFNQHIPNYSLSLGYTTIQTGKTLSLTSIGSAIGSVAIGFICDRLGSLRTCFIMISVGFLSLIGFFIGDSSFYVLLTSAFLYGLFSSGIMVLAPILTLSFFGNLDYERIFAKVSMGAPIASILLIPAYGFIYDYTESYTIVLIVLAVLLAMAILCITIGWRKRCTIDGCPS